MESTSCKMAAMEKVMVDTLPMIRLVPMLMTTAIPMVTRKMMGSNQEAHMMKRITISKDRAVSSSAGVTLSLLSASSVSITTSYWA